MIGFALAAASAGAGEAPALEPAGTTGGVAHYWVTSLHQGVGQVANLPHQGQRTKLRIIAPDGAAAKEDKRFLFVLPVEPREETHYGDGLETVRKTGLHEQLGLIVVAPSFDKLPWYANHPTDQGRQDETYLLEAVIPVVDRLYPSKQPQRLLLGFSKSGWGAFSLILRHPDVFAAAAAWDAPLMKDKPDQFGMGECFATQENFEHYRITKLLREKAAPFQAAKRLWLAGYDNFRAQTVEAHKLMDELHIQHDYADGPKRAHLWGSGWVEEAIKALTEY
ncbi:MAG: alpha/beta hydrolase-fold protein [Planctomycetota bacterium]